MQRIFKLTLILLILQFSLTACEDMKKTMGVEEFKVDFPPGDYLGTIKKIIKRPKEESPEDGVVSEADLYEDIKITFFPKAPDMDDGVGVLIMNDNSQRFYWRNDGNSTNSWNVLFRKDHNLYTDLGVDFKFDGLVSTSEIENKIEGRLHTNFEGQEQDYFVEAFQIFKPAIIPPKAPIEVKAGETVSIDVERIGDNEDEVAVMLRSDKEGTESKMKVQRIVSNEKGTKMQIYTDEGAEKGEYSLYVLRSGKQKSNSVPVNII